MKNKCIVRGLVVIVSLFALAIPVRAKEKPKIFCFQAAPVTITEKLLEKILSYEKGLVIDENHYRQGLTFTEDGGQTWKRMVITPKIAQTLGYKFSRYDQASIESEIMIYFLDNKRGWLSPGGDSGDSTWQTEDGGYTWNRAFNENFSGQPYFLKDKKHGWFFSSRFNDTGLNNIYRTNSGGKKWSKTKCAFPKRGSFDEIYFIDSTIGYSINTYFPNPNDERDTAHGIAKTRDSGHSWKLLWMSPDSDERYSNLQFVNENTGWMQMVSPTSLCCLFYKEWRQKLEQNG